MFPSLGLLVAVAAAGILALLVFVLIP